MTITLAASGVLGVALGLWQAWLYVLRPQLVLRHVRRRYGRIVAWVVQVTGLHHRRW